MLSPYGLLRIREVPSKTIFARKQTRDKQDGEIILNTCCYEIWRNVIVTDWNIWYYIIINTIYVGYVSDTVIPLSVNVAMGSHRLQHTCINSSFNNTKRHACNILWIWSWYCTNYYKDRIPNMFSCILIYFSQFSTICYFLCGRSIYIW